MDHRETPSQLVEASVDLPDLFARAQETFRGRFDIERVVAASPLRVLFVARDTMLNRRVALRIHLDGAGRPREWFVRETELLATLDHPSIRGVFGAGYEEEWAYRVTKWIEGESLADAVTRGPRTIPFVLHLAQDLTSALDYTHSRQIVIRRIVPRKCIKNFGKKLII